MTIPNTNPFPPTKVGDTPSIPAVAPGASQAASGGSVVPAVVGAGVAAAEVLVPALAPFEPLIVLALGYLKAHYMLTQSWPTEEETIAAVGPLWVQLQDRWRNWVPVGP